MTDNISRLYELANIEATAIGCTNEDIQSPDYYSNDCEGDCIDCTWYDTDETYPPFTDTKQLKLLKWIQINKYKSYLYFVDVVSSYFRGLKFKTEEEKRKFIDSEYPQKLANFVCELWEYLTDTQKEEVRGILQ